MNSAPPIPVTTQAGFPVTVVTGACWHRRATKTIGPTTDQINWWCPDCGAIDTTWPDRNQPAPAQRP